MSEFTAAIFDMDGTLLNNMPLYYRAFRVFIERHGLHPPPPAEAARLIGMRQSDIFPALFGRALTPEEIARYSAEAGAIYRSLLAGVTPLPGLLRFLDLLEQRQVRIGLATSAPRDNVAPTLDALGITSRFAAITLGEEVPRGKPAPDIFLEAARVSGNPPTAASSLRTRTLALPPPAPPACAALRWPPPTPPTNCAPLRPT